MRLAQGVPTLQEQYLEHRQRRIGGIAHVVGLAPDLVVQNGVDGLPVDEFVDLIQKCGLGSAVPQKVITQPRSFLSNSHAFPL
jgi:hypothetical protein